MKTIPIGLYQAIRKDAVTLCYIWKLIRQDGKVYLFTNHDADIQIGPDTYVSAIGSRPSAIQTSLGGGVSNMEISALIDSDLIIEDEIISGFWDMAELQVGICDWSSPSDTYHFIAKGNIGQIETKNGMFTAEFKGLAQKIQHENVRVISPECDVVFGSTFCGVNAALYRQNGSVFRTTTPSGLNRSYFRATFTTAQPVGYYNNGSLTFTSGANKSLTYPVLAHTNGNFIELLYEAAGEIKEGDTFTITIGCDKRADTCKTKFNNFKNFQGFPHVPGNDVLTQGV